MTKSAGGMGKQPAKNPGWSSKACWHGVTCVDVDEDKIKRTESAGSPTYEQDLEELMRRNHAEGKIHYTTDYRNIYEPARMREAGAEYHSAGRQGGKYA